MYSSDKDSFILLHLLFVTGTNVSLHQHDIPAIDQRPNNSKVISEIINIEQDTNTSCVRKLTSTRPFECLWNSKVTSSAFLWNTNRTFGL